MMLDLSTGHLPSSRPYWGERGLLRVVHHETGAIVFVDPGVSPLDLPEWIRDIWRTALTIKAILINFDRDAVESADYQTYSW